MQKPEPMDNTEIENIVSDAIDSAVDFVESEIADDRIKAQRYFDGEVDIGHEDGRSRVVSTKVRDTVRNIKPSLLRIFLSNERAVEFVPRKPQDVASAEQATSYINWQFRELGGFRILSDAFHDALVKKQGVVKVWWDEYETGEIFSYSNLTDEEFMFIVNDPEVEVLEHSEEIYAEVDEMGMQIERKEHELKVSRKSAEGKLCAKSVPPEEFFIDRNATSLEDAYVVAHRTEMRVGDLVAMGYDFDEVADLDSSTSGSTGNDMEIYERKGFMEDDGDENAADPSMKLVMVTEAYMRMDIEGTGVPMLYKLTCGGTNYKLLDYELWDEIPFAVFEADPEPHAFYGRSIADLLIDDQDAATSVMRGILDNVALTNNPRMEVLDDVVNIDDLLNNEIGAIVRVRQQGAVQPLAVPFIAGATLPALQYLDQLSETKTGVSRASLGLDPDVMQNTSATAAKLAQSGGQGQVEVIARNFAEGGMRRLFKMMLKLLVKNSPEQELMRLSGTFIPVNPQAWNASMDASANVGLGTGQDDIKIAALNQAMQTQMMIYQQYGPSNGLVSLTQIRNTLADLLSLGGYRNAERYFNPMDPQTEQMLIQQQQQMAAQQAQGQADPNAAYLQAEQIKAQVKMQTDMAKIQATQQSKMAELQQRQQIRGVEISEQRQAKIAELQQRQQAEMAQLRMQMESELLDDDRERDRMAQDLYIKQAEIAAKSGVALDTARIQAIQNAPRDGNGNI